MFSRNGQMIDMALWQGRVDSADGPAALRWHQQVQPLAHSSTEGVGIIGYPCDLGVAANHGRIGAGDGPDQIRRVLARQPWHQPGNIFDCGNILISESLAETQDRLGCQVANLLTRGVAPLVLGGGHDVAWGTYQGLRQHFQKHYPDGKWPTLGILNFDAHFDLRSDAEGASSGTPFFQIAADLRTFNQPVHYATFGISQHANTQALFDRAEALEVTVVADTELMHTHLCEAVERLSKFLQSLDVLYLSIDMDVFPAAVAPGVSAPAPRGVSVEVVEYLLQQVDASGVPVIAAEIAEFNPRYDQDNHTARLAARLAAILSLLLESSRERSTSISEGGDLHVSPR